MKNLPIIILIVFTLSSCGRIIDKYSLNDTYYLKTFTVKKNGYTWTYLCNKKTGDCINIYGEDAYFGRIENIQIQKVVNDTAIFVTFHSGFNNCTYQRDTLIMSECRLLSKPVVKDCPYKVY